MTRMPLVVVGAVLEATGVAMTGRLGVTARQTRQSAVVLILAVMTMGERRLVGVVVVGLSVIVDRGGADVRRAARFITSCVTRTRTKALRSVVTTSRARGSRDRLIRRRTRVSRGRTGVQRVWRGCVG